MLHRLAVSLGVAVGVLILLPVAAGVSRDLTKTMFKPVDRLASFIADMVFGVF